jgi:rhodanese-related sulfurtransferase
MEPLAVEDLLPLCAEHPGRVTLLDVREPWEVATAALQIDGVPTALIPMREIPQRLEELDPSRLIVCLCHHGMRSLQVVAFLSRQGYASVYNLTGGIDAWSVAIDPAVPRY